MITMDDFLFKLIQMKKISSEIALERAHYPDELRIKVMGTAGAPKDEVARGRALEGVLRSTLSAAGARAGEVRVFVSEG